MIRMTRTMVDSDDDYWLGCGQGMDVLIADTSDKIVTRISDSDK